MSEGVLWFQIDSSISYGLPDILRFEIPYVGSLTLYEGDSGKGKTFVVNQLQDFLHRVTKISDARKTVALEGLNKGRVFVINSKSSKEDIDRVAQVKDQEFFVVIDNWDYIASVFPDVVESILEGLRIGRCRYILIGRGSHGLYIGQEDRLKCEVQVEKKRIVGTNTKDPSIEGLQVVYRCYAPTSGCGRNLK